MKTAIVLFLWILSSIAIYGYAHIQSVRWLNEEMESNRRELWEATQYGKKVEKENRHLVYLLQSRTRMEEK